MKTAYQNLLIRIEHASETVTGENGDRFLEALRTAVINANDPYTSYAPHEGYSKVVLVLETFKILLYSDAMNLNQYDTAVISQVVEPANLK